MRILLIASLLTCSAIAAKAQDPSDPPPVVIRQAPPDSGYYDRQERLEENPLQGMTFAQRILVGGGIGGLQLGNPTVININPQVGYQLTPSAIAGINSSYTYQSEKFYNPATNSTFRRNLNLLSLGLFARHQLSFLPESLRNVYAQGEVEQFWGLNYETQFKPAFLLGAGINLSGFNITALYNVNYNDFNSPYSSPLVFRVGGFFIGPRL
ncbi:MAG: hypothetical protein LH606_01400 [Cytophagaceae bacterium]|nr:hypothetical protein [Cytophagaceae bacterium]